MNLRYMRVVVMFDLPVVKSADLKAYLKFRKFLLQDGFFMMQESVYSKISPNTNSTNAIVDRIKRNKPEKGTVQILTITEKQFSNMQTIVGNDNKEDLLTTERILFL